MKNKRFKAKNLCNTFLHRFTNSNRHFTVRKYHYIPSKVGVANIYRRNFKSRMPFYEKKIEYEVSCPDFPCVYAIEEGQAGYNYSSMYGSEWVESVLDKPINISIPFTADTPSERFIPAYWNRIYALNEVPVQYDQYSHHNIFLSPENYPSSKFKLSHPECDTELFSGIGYGLWTTDVYSYFFPFNNTNRVDDYSSLAEESSEDIKDGIYIFRYNAKMYAVCVGNWDNILTYNEDRTVLDPVVVSLDSMDYRVLTIHELMMDVYIPATLSTEEQVLNYLITTLFKRPQGFLYYPVKPHTPMFTHILPTIISNSNTSASGNVYYVKKQNYPSSTAYYYLVSYDSFRMRKPNKICWGSILNVSCDDPSEYYVQSYTRNPYSFPISYLTQELSKLNGFNPSSIDSGEPYYNSYYQHPFSLDALAQGDMEICFLEWFEFYNLRNRPSFVTNGDGVYCINTSEISGLHFHNSIDPQVQTGDYVLISKGISDSNQIGQSYLRLHVIQPANVSTDPFFMDYTVIKKRSGENLSFPYARVLVYNSIEQSKQFIG